MQATLPQLKNIVKPNGRVAIITFHSLEDRIVKSYFKLNADWRNLTKHPLKPVYTEVRENPQSAQRQ